MKGSIIMNDLYLYHATSRENLKSILKNGLLINPPNHNWYKMYLDNQIFLAFNITVAKNYIKSSDYCPKDIVILKIKFNELDENSFNYDWNNRCEYSNEINSVSYSKNIPAKNIIIVDSMSSEPYQDLNSFRKTNLYTILMDVFDYEVETNMEKTH